MTPEGTITVYKCMKGLDIRARRWGRQKLRVYVKILTIGGAIWWNKVVCAVLLRKNPFDRLERF